MADRQPAQRELFARMLAAAPPDARIVGEGIPPVGVRVPLGEEGPDAIVTGIVVPADASAGALDVSALVRTLQSRRRVTAVEYAILTLIADGVMKDAAEQNLPVEQQVAVAVLVVVALAGLLAYVGIPPRR
jgi:hypothetical protein